MDNFSEARGEIEKEIEGLKEGNAAERDYKHAILESKLSYHQLVLGEALVNSINNAATEVNHLKISLVNNMKVINETSEKLNSSIKLAAAEVAVFKEALITSNEKLSNTQTRFQNTSIWLTRIICIATIVYVGFTAWLAVETRTANRIQRANQNRELNLKHEYETLVMENLLEEIDTNLSLIEQINSHNPTDQIKELTTGRFHTYYLDKIKDIYVARGIRAKAMDLLNDIEQGNRYFDALNDSQYKEYFDINLMKFKKFVAITKDKFSDLKQSIERQS